MAVQFSWVKTSFWGVVALSSLGIYACSGQNPSSLPNLQAPQTNTQAVPTTASTATPAQIVDAVEPSPSATAVQASPQVDASQIMTQKCATCHSTHPNPDSGYTLAPLGIRFDTQTDILNHAAEIKKAVLETRTMPLGQSMTEAERTLVGQWVEQLKATEPMPAPTDFPAPIATPVPLASTAPAVDIMPVITQKCAYCHSTHPNAASGYTTAPRALNLDTQDEVIASLTQIKRYVQYGSMPIGGITLSDTERAQILAWVPSGAPAPDPAATAEPLTGPELITVKCAYCHSRTPDPTSGYTRAPGESGGITFDSPEEMRWQRGSIRSSIREGEMPPRKITLTSEEKQIILDWTNSQ